MVDLYKELGELRELLGRCDELVAEVARVGELLARALNGRGQVLTCGNGGSAADALHLAEELTGRYRRDRRALGALSLVADPTALTCIGNDFGFEQIFARQVEALGRPGDVLVAFSTSGNSANILAAIKAAKRRELETVALLGRGGGEARKLADHAIVVPSETTARIQEVHGLTIHLLLEVIEERCGTEVAS